MLQSGTGRVRAVSSDALRQSSELGEEVVIQVPESTLPSGTFLIYGAPPTVASLAAVLVRWRRRPVVAARCRADRQFCYASRAQRIP